MGQDPQRLLLPDADEGLMVEPDRKPIYGAKKFALQPSDFASHEEQQAAIESYLAWRNGSRDLSITAWKAHQAETAHAA